MNIKNLLLIACLSFLALAQSVLAGGAIETEVARAIREAKLGKATFGVLFTDLSTGEDLVETNADKPFVPASNIKLVTTAAALSQFGKDHRFKTQLWVDNDKLIINGGGDPAFCDPVILDEIGLTVDLVLGRWVEAVKKTGRRDFTTLIVNDRVFDNEFVHPSWPRNQLQAWYCAQVAGINFNDNCIDFYASPGAAGRPPTVRMEPAGWPVTLDNRATTGSSKPLGLTRRLDTNQLILSGQISRPSTNPLFVTVHDPPMSFAGVLRSRLQAAGIRIENIRRITAEEDAQRGTLLVSVETPLPTILVRTNRDSHNLFAESLLKSMGHRATGQSGSWSNGTAAVQAFLSEALGASADSVVLDDGSGMSRNNRISPRCFVKVLDYMHSQSELGPVYRDSLAEPGSRGTLRNRFTNGALKGQLFAKSGYINGVVTLSGYLTQGQQTIAFSMLLNNYSGGTVNAKAMMDKIILAVDRSMDGRQSANAKQQFGG